MDESEPELEISNEFAEVEISKVDTGRGERIQIYSPKLDYSIRLDPMALESLTWQSPDLFSECLETPFGPEDDLETDMF